MAMPAVCKPELRTVPITLVNLTSSSYMFPSCTRVEQCGGCCSHPLLSCQPTQTETVFRDVLVIDVDKQTDRYGKKILHVSQFEEYFSPKELGWE